MTEQATRITPANRTSKPRPSLLRRLWRTCYWFTLGFISLSILLVLVFRFAPVPYSGVMMERQIAAWWSGDKNYVARKKWVPYERIAKAAPLALMAGEDQKFPEHYGFDIEQMEKAWTAHQRGKRLRGASTISQQVAKNLFLWSGRSYVRKGLEVWFTLLIEALWSKERILEVHLNIVEYGKGLYGVEAASRVYFGRSAAQLSWSQAALLAAVLPNPHRFKVDKPSAYVYRRQSWILDQMRGLGGTEYLKQLD
ncbi:monofunctional biosynthetic peptidoglycan transglycosylase [Permianibacter sp. IMCC34836]|uniref:monofunctional biosynthetic peptidoglycan transglycosylase n=1 Tax=Permianibacter fluminis TaxID=2738515 RepID=UPI00155435C6|nr:monofunctional biosynthetic peptidoglycan transglycosylase [Permianibacter fluminis]NQD36409.1 monofunctional biosynthetic peptidoglycan transglycosylase [Permianibacter fluminis]